MKILLLLALIIINSSAWASKIGVVNLEEIILKLTIYEPINQEINKLIIKKNQELQIIQNEIKEKEKIIKLGILNKEGEKKINEEIFKLNEYKDLYIKQSQIEVDTREVNLRYPVIKKILLTIKTISKSQNYDLIIEESTPILEQNTQIDNLNQQVIELLNKK